MDSVEQAKRFVKGIRRIEYLSIQWIFSFSSVCEELTSPEFMRGPSLQVFKLNTNHTTSLFK